MRAVPLALDVSLRVKRATNYSCGMQLSRSTRHLRFLGAVIVCLWMTACASTPAPSSTNATIAQSKPIFIEFYADW
jgi:hypothetical protein